MNISEFEPGDEITRSEPARGGDRSFMCYRCKLLSVRGSIIFLSTQLGVIKLPVFDWSDGWEAYPSEFEDSLNELGIGDLSV